MGAIVLVRVVAVMTAALAGAACSGRRAEQPFDRTETCDEWCGMSLDPMCGVEDPETTMTECVDGCLDPDAIGWEPCVEERLVRHECVKALDCEERRIYFNELTPSSCYDETLTWQVCYVEANQ